MIDWGIVVSVVGVATTVAINVGTLSYIQGRSITRLEVLEKSLEKLEVEISEVRKLRSEIEVVKSQITNVGVAIAKLDTMISTSLSRGHSNEV